MKKIIVALLLAISLISFQQAGAQQLKFYYYPSSNVYYDLAHHHYVYLNNGTWTTINTYPPRFSTRDRRVVIYHSGPEVWMDNTAHYRKYYNVPRGRAVGWHGRNPNRAKGKYKH